MKTTGVQSLRKELDQKAIEIANLALLNRELEEKALADRHEIQKLKSTVAELEDEQKMSNQGSEIIRVFYNKEYQENQRLKKELEDTQLALKNLQDKVLEAFNQGFNPKVHAPNAIQTNPGDENY